MGTIGKQLRLTNIEVAHEPKTAQALSSQCIQTARWPMLLRQSAYVAGRLPCIAGEHGLSLKHAKRRKCTAEHLVARRDGGADVQSNIAAACLDCNLTRDRRKVVQRPERWRAARKRRACTLRANILETAPHLANQLSLAVFSTRCASIVESNFAACCGQLVAEVATSPKTGMVAGVGVGFSFPAHDPPRRSTRSPLKAVGTYGAQ
jgi:hypothetical protein